MIEDARGLGLQCEAAQAFSILGESHRQDSDGDGAIEARIAGFVHLARPAGAQQGEDFVRAELIACTDSRDKGLR